MDPSLLIILLFILAPLLERLIRAGKGGPQQRPPVPRPPQPRQTPPPERRPRVIVARPEEDEPAAAMLPDDLWEILTGERRAPQPRPQPLPPAPQEQEEAYSLEAASEEDWLEEEIADQPMPAGQRPREEWRTSAELEPVPAAEYVRPIPQREVPAVVSLEKLEIDSGKRHDAFHDRLRQLAAATPEREARAAFSLSGADDLRRAVILSEILGPPRSLQ